MRNFDSFNLSEDIVIREKSESLDVANKDKEMRRTVAPSIMYVSAASYEKTAKRSCHSQHRRPRQYNRFEAIRSSPGAARRSEARSKEV